MINENNLNSDTNLSASSEALSYIVALRVKSSENLFRSPFREIAPLSVDFVPFRKFMYMRVYS